MTCHLIYSQMCIKLYMFADDTNIFNIIKSPEEQDILQNYLDSLSVWSDKWLLKFHPEKFKVMHLGKADNTEYFYNLKEADVHTMNWHIVIYRGGKGSWCSYRW